MMNYNRLSLNEWTFCRVSSVSHTSAAVIGEKDNSGRRRQSEAYRAESALRWMLSSCTAAAAAEQVVAAASDDAW